MKRKKVPEGFFLTWSIFLGQFYPAKLQRYLFKITKKKFPNTDKSEGGIFWYECYNCSFEKKFGHKVDIQMVFLQYAIEYVSLHPHAIFSKMFFDNRDMPNDQDQFEWVDSAIEWKNWCNFCLKGKSIIFENVNQNDCTTST